VIVVAAGTQRVISFLRQMVEHGGFYRTSDQSWVKFERIQFVGACNPPTDPGRKPLSHRSAYASSYLQLSCMVICCKDFLGWLLYLVYISGVSVSHNRAIHVAYMLLVCACLFFSHVSL